MRCKYTEKAIVKGIRNSSWSNTKLANHLETVFDSENITAEMSWDLYQDTAKCFKRAERSAIFRLITCTLFGPVHFFLYFIWAPQYLSGASILIFFILLGIALHSLFFLMSTRPYIEEACKASGNWLAIAMLYISIHVMGSEVKQSAVN